MRILGINCFSHDTAAALVADGIPIAIGEQERFNRDKHTLAFPDDAVAFCLERAGISIADVDVVAFAHRTIDDLRRGAADAVLRLRSVKRLRAQWHADVKLHRKERDFVRRWNVKARVVRVGHHRAHAAAAFFPSGFEDAAVLTLDRGGDWLSTTLQHGRGTRLRTLKEIRNPHSLGEVYTALTWWLGFHPNGDEGKVMGLAPYGTGRLDETFRDLVRLSEDGMFHVDLRWFQYHWGHGWMSNRFLETYGPRREPESEILELHEDVAHALQTVTEETALHVARALHRLTGSPNLALAGGVALNSVMNARLLHETPFERVFVQPAAGDAGNAVGAALEVWHGLLGRPRSWRMTHAFYGPEPSPARLRTVAGGSGIPMRETTDAPGEAAGMVADGRIVGWFRGPAEIGPRALGARSILADPRRPEMKDVVNARVKRREGFRPFAPAVLHEHGPMWFEGYSHNPFMLLVLPIRRERREEIPSVVHVDGTGRFQSVDADTNPELARLIRAFHERTDVPVVLNTSFNLRGEPIVNTPEEALADFVASDMDALFLGDLVLVKPDRLETADFHAGRNRDPASSPRDPPRPRSL